MAHRGRPGWGSSDQDPLAGWSRLSVGLQALLTALAYLAAAGIAAGITRAGEAVYAFWPAAGVGVLALTLSPVRRWPALCLAIGSGSAVFGVLRGFTPAYAAGYAGADTLGALAGAAVTLALIHGARPDWQRLSHVWATIAGAGMAAPALGGAAGAVFAVQLTSGDFWNAWLRWAAGSAVGALLVGGLFFAVPRDGRLLRLPERRVEASLCMLVAGLVCGVSLGFTHLPLIWLALLPVFWAALRLEPVGTAFTLCVTGVVSIALTAQGLGHYALAGTPDVDGVLLVQGFLFVAIAFGASQAASTTAQGRAAERLHASEEQLREAQKMEGIGRLAGTIAHDFNNLLTVVDGFGRLGLERVAEGRDPTGALEEIVAAGERGRALTSRLLTFSRAQAAAPDPVSLDDAVRALQPVLEGLLGDRHVLALELAGDAGLVALDPVHLEQAIANLVANARDAMPRGGQVILETRRVTIEDGADARVPAGRWVLLGVHDAGVGMNEHTRSRALEPFFTTRSRGAAGLGLAIVYGVVEQAGGHLAIDTELLRGTSVRLYLPPALGPAHVSPRAPAWAGEAGEAGERETLLLAEDDPSLRLLGRTVLEERGYAVLAAGDGDEALALAAAHDGPISLLVTDIVMPGMGGPELHSRLLARRPGLRVLYTSGYPQRELTPSATLDRENFLPKPYTPAELARRVRELLDDAAVS